MGPMDHPDKHSNPSRLVPHDARVREQTARVRGKTYAYLLGEPTDARYRRQPRDTILLLHGFPDLPFGWRCQIPFLLAGGFRVVAPTMLGYGGTSRPDDLRQWSLKSIADDMRALAARFVGEEGQVVVGGHDWGGALAWRVALWHPPLVRAVFSVCTPYAPPGGPGRRFVSLEEHLAAGRVPHFRYQVQLAGGDVEARLRTGEPIRQFLDAVFGGVGPGGEPGFTAARGVDFGALPRLGGRSTLVSGEEMAYYVGEYMRQGAPPMRGPLNWYRTRRLNHEEERGLKGGGRLEMPALFIAATEDAALPPAMAAGMERHFRDLTRGEVRASHWALVEAGEEVNGLIGGWLDRVVPGSGPRSTL